MSWNRLRFSVEIIVVFVFKWFSSLNKWRTNMWLCSLLKTQKQTYIITQQPFKKSNNKTTRTKTQNLKPLHKNKKQTKTTKAKVKIRVGAHIGARCLTQCWSCLICFNLFRLLNHFNTNATIMSTLNLNLFQLKP